jgi:hypothetical protein
MVRSSLEYCHYTSELLHHQGQIAGSTTDENKARILLGSSVIHTTSLLLFRDSSHYRYRELAQLCF